MGGESDIGCGTVMASSGSATQNASKMDVRCCNVQGTVIPASLRHGTSKTRVFAPGLTPEAQLGGGEGVKRASRVAESKEQQREYLI